MAVKAFGGGAVCCSNNVYVILYNENALPRVINWALAHELGHIFLGHIKDEGIEEIEANFFAAELLAPECLLYEMWRKREA